VRTGEVIYADEGSGELLRGPAGGWAGPRADYDSTLNDKVLDAAHQQSASHIIENLLQKPWEAYLIAYSDGYTLSQGGRARE